jgi:hypothetical protein
MDYQAKEDSWDYPEFLDPQDQWDPKVIEDPRVKEGQKVKESRDQLGHVVYQDQQGRLVLESKEGPVSEENKADQGWLDFEAHQVLKVLPDSANSATTLVEIICLQWLDLEAITRGQQNNSVWNLSYILISFYSLMCVHMCSNASKKSVHIFYQNFSKSNHCLLYAAKISLMCSLCRPTFFFQLPLPAALV